MDKNHQKTRKIVGIGVFAAIVVVLQFVSMGLRFSMFSITLTLLPVVVGAALFGVGAGAILGAVFGLAVLLTGDANAFFVVNPIGTIFTVMLKGTAAGFLSGLVYNLLSGKNETIASICSAVTAPITNTGIFIICCYIFFMDTVSGWASAMGFENATAYIFIGLAGINFLIELAINLVLSPVIVRLVHIAKKEK